MHGGIPWSFRAATFIAILTWTAATGCQQSPHAGGDRHGQPDGCCACRMEPSERGLVQQMQVEDQIHDLKMRWAAQAGNVSPRAALPIGAAFAENLEETLKAIEGAVRSTGQNLRNANTFGHRASKTVFRADDGRSEVFFDMSQGSPIQGGRDLDLMITGPGFFSVKMNRDGPVAYTRAGNFFINTEHEFVLGWGDAPTLDPGLIVPADATSIQIGSDGTVVAFVPAAVTPTVLGQIQLTRFANPEKLRSDNGTLFYETKESGVPQLSLPGEGGAGTLQQRCVESSNVDVVEEVATLARLRRWYEDLWQARQISVGMKRQERTPRRE